MVYKNINIRAFAPSTYTFSWSRQKTPSQLVKELTKNNTAINVDMRPPILRRTKPIRIKMEEVIEVSPVNLCTKYESEFDFFSFFESE